MREIDKPISNEEYAKLRERFSADDNNYNLLNTERQVVRSRTEVWDNDYIKEIYVQQTDRMIGLLDGSIRERKLPDPDNWERSHDVPNTVIWLDKSARPVSWLVDAFWEQMARKDAQKPDDAFLNIDRVDWITRQNPGLSPKRAEDLGMKGFDINKVPDEDIARIRAIFVEGEIDRDNWQEDVWNHPTSLDGKNILVVDEVSSTGATLKIAQLLLKRAFPDAVISGDYFWPNKAYALGGQADKLQMESIPVWYSDQTVFGRGIGDVSKAYYEHLPDTPENFKKRLGWIALSAPHHKNGTYDEIGDPLADQLKQDIAYLTYDVADGHILHKPDGGRGDEFDDIIADQGLTLRQFAQYHDRITTENNRLFTTKKK